MEPKRFHISVEGIPGAGKSYLLNKIKELIETKHLSYKFDIFPEPVDKWLTFGEEKVNLLKNMYEDQPNSGFIFQTAALFTKLEQLQFEKQYNFVERSLASQENIFIPQLFFQRSISQLEHDILKYIFTVCEKWGPTPPDLIIYLSTPAELALERLRKRARVGESQVTLEYLQLLKLKHEQWLTKLGYNSGPEVITVDAKQGVDAEKLVANILKKLDQ